MRFCFVDIGGGRIRTEDLQDAELEVACVGGVESCQLTESDVAAVAVSGVCGPASQDPLTAVRFPDIELPGAGIGDEVDALHGPEGGAPSRCTPV